MTDIVGPAGQERSLHPREERAMWEAKVDALRRAHEARAQIANALIEQLTQERDALRAAGQQLLDAANDLTTSEPCSGSHCPGCALLKAKATWEALTND